MWLWKANVFWTVLIGWLRIKNPPAMQEVQETPVLSLGLGRSPRRGNRSLFKYSCLGNPMDRKAWWVTVHGVMELDKTESESEVAQSWPTLCNPMDWRLPGSSAHGIFQARVLEWFAVSFSRGSSQPRDRTWVSPLQADAFSIWSTREVLYWTRLSTHRKGPAWP